MVNHQFGARGDSRIDFNIGHIGRCFYFYIFLDSAKQSLGGGGAAKGSTGFVINSQRHGLFCGKENVCGLYKANKIS